MDNKQQHLFLQLNSHIQKLKKSIKKEHNQHKLAKFNRDLLDTERKLKQLIHSLSQDDLRIVNISLRKRKISEKKTIVEQKQDLNNKTSLSSSSLKPIKEQFPQNNPNGTDAGRAKFDNISNKAELLTKTASKHVKSNEEELTENNNLVTLKLIPIHRKDIISDITLANDTEKHISVQYEKSKLDQANFSHHATQNILENFLDIFSVQHTETKHIDIYADINGIPHIFEIKSISLRNEVPQTREAVGQLNEYAYLYGISNPRLYLVFSSQPKTKWLLDYLFKRMHINVIWIDISHKNLLAGPGLKSLEQECLRHYKSNSSQK